MIYGGWHIQNLHGRLAGLRSRRESILLWRSEGLLLTARRTLLGGLYGPLITDENI